MGSTYWSENGQFMAYSVQIGGSDWKTIYVKDVATGKDLPNDELMWIKFSGASWKVDNSGFFYSKYDIPKSYMESHKEGKADVKGKQGQETDKLSNMKIYFHKIGDKQEKDVLLFDFPKEPDAMLSAHSTHDGNYLMIIVNKGNDGKVLLYYADLTDPANKKLDQKLVVKPIVSEWIATYDYIINFGKEFYFQTDYNAQL